MTAASQAPVLGDIGAEVALLVRQGADFGPHEVTLTNPDGSPVNLTGATLSAQMRRRGLSAGAPLLTFGITVLDAANGLFEFGLTAAQTGALVPGETLAAAESRATWALDLLDTLGRSTPIFHGSVSIFREVVR